ncbi:hypothetical protein M408DRAFT_303614 [Serendipita vermifera MAFF 305830]|uniref:RNA helicase n=1 Tax=Serendipita vermifera MAFF 305830 TaxID=933852 RepID=A0A0C3BC47_SERVB|nr:hypothetical protein M408DRAFT_303614 [Serendipita vermifera MAFF 305830]
MGKKKKTQLKPVARGFATTSVPSKKAVTEPESGLPSDQASTSAGDENAENPNNASIPPVPQSLSQELAQEQFLQGLVDKWQDKTEREIGRTLKALEFDRRMAKSYSQLNLDPVWRERIFELVREEQGQFNSLKLNDTEEKLLPRLAWLYGTLRRVGLAEEQTKQCLESSQRLDMEEALEWVLLHYGEDVLDWDKGKFTTAKVRPPRPGYTFSSVPPTPLLSSRLSAFTIEESGMNEHTTASSSYDREKSVGQGASLLNEPPPGAHSGASFDDTSLDCSPSFSDDESVVPELNGETDPNVMYGILRVHLLRVLRSELEEKRREKRVSVIQKQIDSLKGDYMFSSRLADADFASRRVKMEAETLQERLKRGSGPGQLPVIESPSAKQTARKKIAKSLTSLSAPSPTTPSTPLQAESEEDDTLFGNLLEEMPTEEITSTGTVITVKDMSLPKHWSGKTPKSLLNETALKVDRYVTVQYVIISGGSRAVRCRCVVRWAGGRREEWAMDTIACQSSDQAEHYIATVALHHITFPLSVGFAGGPTTNGLTTNYRVLPPKFRDLWDELEALRKVEEDSINRAVWSEVKVLLDKKLASREDSGGPRAHHQEHRPSFSGDQQPGHIAASFYAVQSTDSYQMMLKQRQTLPIAAYRNEIIQTLETHQVLVLSGETGCGKSTQLPAYIMEDQLSRGKSCRIICTEPRRISAISLAQRVSAEMGEPPGAAGTNNSLIGYSIRLESNITKSTRLAFVTNGIALRMLEGGSNSGSGASIDEVTHLIVDEVSSSSIESDFLLIILKSLLGQRPDLRVVLMSATLDAEKISGFFGDCPIIRVPGRTFPVDIAFLEDAIEFSGWQIKDSSPYAKRKNDKFSRSKNAQLEWTEETIDIVDEDEGIVPDSAPVVLGKRYSPETVSTINLLDERQIPYELIVRMLERLCFEDDNYIAYSAAILVFMPGLNEIRRLHDMLLSHDLFSNDAFRIFPLHSTISSEGQGAVFEIPPTGVRKIVISTNIAETGITIPDCTTVIDSGKVRSMMFDEKRQLSRLVETFIAKSNAAQRRGRAGRVRSGLCFHLFTKLRHDTVLAEHPVPEMLRLSLSDLALRTKIMKVDVGSSIEEVLSKALDPPSPINIQRAVSSLVEAGALTASEEITGLGRYLAQLPTDVSLGKFLLMATVLKCLDPALTIAAALSSKSPFVTPFGKEDEAERQKASFRIVSDNSDFLTIHNAFATWRRACANGQSVARTLCRKSFLSYQNLQQIEEIRQQYLSYLVDSSLIRVDRAYERELSRARYNQNRGKPRFIMVPNEYDVHSTTGKVSLINAAIIAGLYPKVLIIDSGKNGAQQMRTLGNNQRTYFHPSSVNFGRKPLDVSSGANCLVYFTLMHSKKLYAWETGPVDDLSMVLLCGDLSSKSLVLDRKIKYRTDPRSAVALKHLRERLQRILHNKFKGGRTPLEISEKWDSLAMAVLGKKMEEIVS